MDLKTTRNNEVSPENPIENDLYLDNGTIVLVDGDEAIKQAVLSRLNFFLGEWFLNTLEGTPWFQHILVKGPQESVVRDIFRRVCLGTPGVVEFTQFKMSINAQRKASISMDVRTDSGSILPIQYENAMVIKVFTTEE